MARGTNCGAHVHDSLVPIEMHHIWPLGYHGPDIKANRIPLCANAHGDVHYLLEMMLKADARGERLSWVVRRTFGAEVRNIAWQGFVRVVAYADELAGSVGAS